MAKGSDNPFPSVLVVEGTEPAAPAAGRQRLYIDSTTHTLHRTDSAGAQVDLEAGTTAHLADTTDAHDASAVSFSPTGAVAATDVQTAIAELDTEKATVAQAKTEAIGVALSDETTAITTGTAKATIRMPFAMTLTDVRANLNTVSSSGTPTVDINEAGSTILSTKLTIDVSEKTSTTAAAAAVISDASLADDAEITFDIDVAGTGAKGLKVWLIGTRA